MNKKYPCIESTEDFEAGDYLIRLWVGESEVNNNYDNQDIVNLALQNSNLPAGELARRIADSFERLNAVQIKSKGVRSSGVMIYTVDF